MKKFIAFAMIAAMALGVVGCGNSDTPPSAAEEVIEEAAADAAQEVEQIAETAAEDAIVEAGKDFKVAMVTDVGGVNDQSFNQSAWEGLQKLEADTGIKTSYLESQQETNYGPNLDKLIDGGNNLVWGVGYMMADAMVNAANMNPDINFGIVDNAYETVPPNLACAVFKAQEPSFLVGYIAGKTTKTGKVGFLGGIKGDVIDQFEYGYRAGVYTAAKEDGREVQVDVQYAESFADDAKGKAIAQAMYTNDCDIVFHAAGGAGIGLIEAAKEMDKLAIGVDRDQSYLAPDNVMTSALKLVGSAMYDISVRTVAGENLGGQVIPYGLKEKACGIPPYEGSTEKLVDKEVYDKAIALQEKIVSEEIVVPFTEEALADFMK